MGNDVVTREADTMLILTMITFIITMMETVLGEDNFNIFSVQIVMSPEPCSEDVRMVIIIHSHPEHYQLRKILRKTWANESLHSDYKMKRIFMLGTHSSSSSSSSSVVDNIRQESEDHGDIVQGDFTDSYRNMTYKHLLGYRWCEEHCPGADHVLKTDDDQFVDTLQLPRFLTTFLPQTDRKWFLCHVLDNDPQRHVSSKWFVTREEWPGDTYPQYCAGWAYVTTPATVKQILKWSQKHPYFWIDDLHVTGVIPDGSIDMFDWKYSFLSYHIQTKNDVLHGSFYTPELMVCGDVTA